MRKILFIIVTMAALATGAKAQDRIFVYRNDGGFDAFLKSEVDSMTLSHEDAEGKYHAGWETQLIHTPDSTYRIPLAAIDSISFFAPPTILNKDVFILTAEHDAYITRADTVSFTFAPGTPEELLPEKGNLVVSRYDCTSFPDGIVARVTYMAEDAAGMHYECERAGIDEVFDQILLYEDTLTHINKRTKNQSTEIIDNLFLYETFEKTFSKDGTTLDLRIYDEAEAKVIIRKIPGLPFYFRLELDNDLEGTPTLTATSEANIEASADIVRNLSLGRVPIPGTPLFFVPKFSMAGYFNLTGEVKLETEATIRRNDKVAIEYANGEWTWNHSSRADGGFSLAQLSMDGAAEIGVKPEMLFSFCGTATGVGVNFSAGLKEYVNFKFDALEYFDTGAYAALKDSKARTTVPYSISAFAQAGLFDFKNSPRWTYTFSDEKPLGEDKYLLPEFSDVEYSAPMWDRSSLLFFDVSRNLILPVDIGLAYFDKNGNLKIRQYIQEGWRQWGTGSDRLSSELPQPTEFTEYIVHPLIKIMDKELVDMSTSLNIAKGGIVGKWIPLRGSIKYSFYPDYDYRGIGYYTKWSVDGEYLILYTFKDENNWNKMIAPFEIIDNYLYIYYGNEQIIRCENGIITQETGFDQEYTKVLKKSIDL